MSSIRLVIRDRLRSITGTLHGSSADRVIAALSAEPETIEELVAALHRFEHFHGNEYFAPFASGDFDEPYDAGIVAIDLPGRLIAGESTYSALCSRECRLP